MIVIIIVAALVLIDQLSKLYFELNFHEGEIVTVIKKFFYFTKTYNTGAAWSAFSDSTLFLAFVSLIATVIIGFIMYKTVNLKTKKTYSYALILMLGGTAGNLIDRFMTSFKLRDGVVDFIGVWIGSYQFPVFNLADSFLVIGVILLSIDLLFFEEKRKSNEVKISVEEGEEVENENNID